MHWPLELIAKSCTAASYESYSVPFNMYMSLAGSSGTSAREYIGEAAYTESTNVTEQKNKNEKMFTSHLQVTDDIIEVAVRSGSMQSSGNGQVGDFERAMVACLLSTSITIQPVHRFVV